MIHIESLAPRLYTVGDFFDIWGTTSQAGPATGTLTAYVNGSQYRGDPRAIVLGPHTLIQARHRHARPTAAIHLFAWPIGPVLCVPSPGQRRASPASVTMTRRLTAAGEGIVRAASSALRQ